MRVGRLGGVAIDVHLTFGLVLIWGGWQGWVQIGGWRGALYGVAGMLLLFGSVLAHELGHAWQARALGLTVRHILMLPIGGVAHLETTHFDPWQELLFTLAGPLVNLVLALMLGVAAYWVEPFDPLNWREQIAFLSQPGLGTLLRFLFWVNASLFLFNMLPAFPIDGGRILRAALAILTSYATGTQVALSLGYLMAGAALVVGVLGPTPWQGIRPVPLLILLALIVSIGVRYEQVYVRLQRALIRLEVADILRPAQQALAPSHRLTRRLAAAFLRHEYTLPVFIDHRLVGLLSFRDIRRAIRSLKEDATVAHYMRTVFPILQSRDTLWAALQEMEQYDMDALPVFEKEEFRGLVTLADIQNAWRITPRRAR